MTELLLILSFRGTRHLCLLLTFVARVSCSLFLLLFVALVCFSTRLDSSFLGMTKSLKSFVIPTEEEYLFVALVCCSHLLLNSFRFLVPRNDKILEEFCHCFANSLLVSDRGGISVCCSLLLLVFVAHICCSQLLLNLFRFLVPRNDKTN
jgi:hypothetical protein